MRLEYLANQVEHLPELAQWYFAEWGSLHSDSSQSSIEESLNQYLNTSEIPLAIIAVETYTLAGAVQLKFREMSIYPEKEHWLGGVYVHPNFRKLGVAETLIERVVEIARGLGVKVLYLQTERLDGGLYSRMGWRAIERVNYRNIDVLVMERTIA